MSKTNGVDSLMKRFLILFIMAAYAVGCGPSVRYEELITEECTPGELSVQPNDRQLTIRWETNCPDDKLLSGYFIYLEPKPVSEKYLASYPPKSLKPFNLAPYPGDTDPESSYETMVISNLENGVEYFVSVRTVFPDKKLSVSSNQVSTMCRPEGEFELAFRYAAPNDGFSFSNNTAVRADAEENDIYFYNKDGFDFLASPHRINGFLRESKFYSLGKTKDIYQYPTMEIDFEAVEKMPVLVGESYLIKTADNKYAKIRIEDTSGEGKQRVLKIKYIYQTKSSLMRF